MDLTYGPGCFLYNAAPGLEDFKRPEIKVVLFEYVYHLDLQPNIFAEWVDSRMFSSVGGDRKMLWWQEFQGRIGEWYTAMRVSGVLFGFLSGSGDETLLWLPPYVLLCFSSVLILPTAMQGIQNTVNGQCRKEHYLRGISHVCIHARYRYQFDTVPLDSVQILPFKKKKKNNIKCFCID